MMRPAVRLPLAGGLAALALPPFNLVFLLWLSLPLLLSDIDRRRSWRGAFAAGWLWGLGYFALGLYWISVALMVDAARFGWLIPIALFGLAGLLALYVGSVAAIAWQLAPGWPRLLLFAVAWGVGEGLRGLLLTGFPWNPIASVWSVSTAMLQSVAVIGSLGLGVLTVAAAGAPALWRQSRRLGGLATLGGLLLLALLAGAGAWRLPSAAMPVQPGVRLRLVQANIAQTLKWRPEMRDEHLAQQLALSRTPADQPLTAIIWPETAAPAFLDQDWQARQAIAAAAPSGGLMLVGTLRGRIVGRDVVEVWNSLQAVDSNGAIVGQYDKAHLVPFGEYVPLPDWIPLAKLTAITLPITPGPGPRTLSLPGLPAVGPMICYEVIFPNQVIDRAHRPAWMLNLTNDGWFGNSSGPYQHFVAARLRAVEEGLPLVRAAYTGISGVIDPYGRVVAELGLDSKGVVDSDLPQPLGETVFAAHGRLLLTILLTVSGALALIGDRRARRPQPKR
jgi:apolipoprotein N-acyltransferase